MMHTKKQSLLTFCALSALLSFGNGFGMENEGLGSCTSTEESTGNSTGSNHDTPPTFPRNQEFAQLKTENQSPTEIMQDGKTEIAKKDEMIQKYSEITQQQKDQISKLTNAIKEVADKKNNLRTTNKQYKKEISDLQAQVITFEKLKQEHVKCANTISVLEKKIDAKISEIHNLNSQLTEANNHNNLRNEEVAEFNQKIKALKTDLDATQQALTDVKAEKVTLETNLGKTTTEMEDAYKRLAATQKTLKLAEDAKANLQEQIRSKDNALSAKSSVIESLIANHSLADTNFDKAFTVNMNHNEASKKAKILCSAFGGLIGGLSTYGLMAAFNLISQDQRIIGGAVGTGAALGAGIGYKMANSLGGTYRPAVSLKPNATVRIDQLQVSADNADEFIFKPVFTSTNKD